MNIQGPYLPHCYKCSTFTMILSHISLVYIVASIVYKIGTSCIGTPFKDSLTEDQLQIKKKSAEIRSKIFLIGLVCGFLTMHLTKPFR